MKNVNFWRAAQKTEGRAGGMHKKAVLQKRVGRVAENGSPPAHPFPQDRLFVHPVGPPFCFLCCLPKVHVFHLETRPSV